ncbi:hypothetical protein ZWY2020_051272 [Hordeum vulgare]|nr:hypothetical protein ZWY2020_051272 [Hordeum vulgare]
MGLEGSAEMPALSRPTCHGLPLLRATSTMALDVLLASPRRPPCSPAAGAPLTGDSPRPPAAAPLPVGMLPTCCVPFLSCRRLILLCHCCCLSLPRCSVLCCVFFGRCRGREYHPPALLIVSAVDSKQHRSRTKVDNPEYRTP